MPHFMATVINSGVSLSMPPIEGFICYGKRIFALRAGGFEVHDRALTLCPTAFGLARAKKHAASLGLMQTTHPAAS